jgi:sulfite exporter TauE/SafE
MIAFGLVSLARLAGWSFARLHPPAPLLALSQSLHRRAMNTPPLARATTIGLLTTLLPCGWLWAFVVTAAGTASAAWGAVAMAIFWAGTLPVMVTLGAGVQGAMGTLGRRLPVLTCLLLVGVGVWTLVGRSMLDVQAFASSRGGVVSATDGSLPSAPSPDMVPDCCKPDAQDQ